MAEGVIPLEKPVPNALTAASLAANRGGVRFHRSGCLFANDDFFRAEYSFDEPSGPGSVENPLHSWYFHQIDAYPEYHASILSLRIASTTLQAWTVYAAL